jgi:hypothetical protein
VTDGLTRSFFGSWLRETRADILALEQETEGLLPHILWEEQP